MFPCFSFECIPEKPSNTIYFFVPFDIGVRICFVKFAQQRNVSSINKNILMLNGYVFCVIAATLFILPNQLRNKVCSTKNLIANILEIFYFTIIDGNENYTIIF